MEIDRLIKDKKIELLAYFRSRAAESLTLAKNKFAENQPNYRAKEINNLVNSSKNAFITAMMQKANNEGWTNTEKLECLLMVNYCNIIVMIESRNSLRAYEYMDFSRRIGELWDPFCKLCFTHSINKIELFIPPLFSDVKKDLHHEIQQYIDQLTITDLQKFELKKYYDKVWSLITSGEIQLELDLHFIYNGTRYVADFKSGFGSNEKGNTNRLLLVASIYKNVIKEDYECLLLVRSEENNSYFNTLKRSGVWNTHCGDDAYKTILKFTGYDLKQWISKNIDWANDFNKETSSHFEKQRLLQYLKW